MNFERCELENSTIRNCNLRNVEISNSDLTGMKIYNISVEELLAAYVQMNQRKLYIMMSLL
ncbi:pentapeptide repeat-containing protein [Paenibacillus arenosi]|nr:pentapeptide repeat-containing protein [Paenibacillus arenosi]